MASLFYDPDRDESAGAQPLAPTAPTPAASTHASDAAVPLAVAIAGCIAMAIGTFLPAADTSYIRVVHNTLMQTGDGWVVLVLAVACAGSAWAYYAGSAKRRWTIVVGALLAALVAYAEARSIQVFTINPLTGNAIPGTEHHASPAIGIYVVGVGALLTAVAATRLQRRA